MDLCCVSSCGVLCVIVNLWCVVCLVCLCCCVIVNLWCVVCLCSSAATCVCFVCDTALSMRALTIPQYPWEAYPTRYHDHNFTVATFYIDLTPVTNEQFAAFLNVRKTTPLCSLGSCTPHGYTQTTLMRQHLPNADTYTHNTLDIIPPGKPFTVFAPSFCTLTSQYRPQRTDQRMRTTFYATGATAHTPPAGPTSR